MIALSMSKQNGPDSSESFSHSDIGLLVIDDRLSPVASTFKFQVPQPYGGFDSNTIRADTVPGPTSTGFSPKKVP